MYRKFKVIVRLYLCTLKMFYCKCITVKLHMYPAHCASWSTDTDSECRNSSQTQGLYKTEHVYNRKCDIITHKIIRNMFTKWLYMHYNVCRQDTSSVEHEYVADVKYEVQLHKSKCVHTMHKHTCPHRGPSLQLEISTEPKFTPERLIKKQ